MCCLSVWQCEWKSVRSKQLQVGKPSVQVWHLAFFLHRCVKEGGHCHTAVSQAHTSGMCISSADVAPVGHVSLSLTF